MLLSIIDLSNVNVEYRLLLIGFVLIACYYIFKISTHPAGGVGWSPMLYIYELLPYYILYKNFVNIRYSISLICLIIISLIGNFLLVVGYYVYGPATVLLLLINPLLQLAIFYVLKTILQRI